MYIKLKRNSKSPVEKWREFQYSRSDLDGWVAQGGNIGFACGHDDVVVLDIDDKQKCAELEVDPYVDTYTVRTGKGGYHFYYRIPDCPIMRAYDPRDGAHIADIQALGTYVVAPPSIHPDTKKPYEVINDLPILDVSIKELKHLLRRTTSSKVLETQPKATRNPNIENAFTIDQVWSLAGFKQVGDQLVGPHPVHGSKTGHNLVVNIKDDVWWCGRHRTGGSAKEALAVDAGLVECADVTRGCLKGLTWIQLAKEARRRGLI